MVNTSKPAAARWAIETLEKPWRALVSTAAAWRPGMQFNKLEETLEFIQFSLEARQRLSTGGEMG